MNTLSWLVYLADLCQSLVNIFIVFVVLSGGILLISGVTWGVNRAEAVGYGEPRSGNYISTAAIAHKWMVFAATAFFTFGILLAIIPSKQTVLIIATSEVTDRMVSSQAGQEIITESLATIKDVLKSLRKDVK